MQATYLYTLHRLYKSVDIVFGISLGGNGAGVYIIHRMRSIDNLPDNQYHFLADVRVSSSSLLFIDCDKNNESLHFIQEGPVQKAPYFHSPEPVYLAAVGICCLCWWC